MATRSWPKIRPIANGEWVIVAQDPPLTAGPHELRVIQHVDGRAPVTSDQVVVAVVPDQKQSGPEKKTFVLIAPPTAARRSCSRRPQPACRNLATS